VRPAEFRIPPPVGLIWQLEQGAFVRLENRGRQKAEIENERKRRMKKRHLFM